MDGEGRKGGANTDIYRRPQYKVSDAEE